MGNTERKDTTGNSLRSKMRSMNRNKFSDSTLKAPSVSFDMSIAGKKFNSSDANISEYFDFDVHQTTVEELGGILMMVLAKEQRERRELEEKVLKEFQENQPGINVEDVNPTSFSKMTVPEIFRCKVELTET